MRRLTRHFATARSPRTPRAVDPAWSRVVALCCVLLITLGACVQACHVHDDGGPAAWKVSQKSQQPAPGNTPASPADHCLLCVAMHAAMPSAQGVAPVPVRQIQQTISVALLPRRVQGVSFDLFSRPPPPPIE